MQLIKDSAICSALLRFWYVLISTWDESAIISGWNRFSRRIGSQIRGSRALRRVMRTGRIVRDWPESLAYRLLSFLINLVPRLLHRLYARSEGLFEGSRILRALFYCGERTATFLSWLLLALLVIPQDYWKNMYSLAGLGAILLIFWLGGMRRRNLRLDLHHVGPYPVMFAAVVLVFLILSRSPSDSLRFFMFHFTCMLAVLLLVSAIKTQAELVRFAAFAVAGLLIASLYGFFQKAMGIEVDKLLVDVSSSADTPGRVFSFFENANSFAFILVMLGPLSLTLMFYAKKWLRLLGALSFLCAMLALLLTYSRGGYVSIVAAILLYVLILRPQLLPLLAALGLLAIPVLPESIYNRILSIFSGNDTSISSRGLLYEAAWKLIRFNPVRGVGIGNTVVKEAVEGHSFYTNPMIFIHTHDIYLQIWCETGVFGLFAFLAAMFSAIRSGLHAAISRRADPILRGIVAAGIAGLFGILVNGIVDYPWSYPRVMLVFWILFGLLLAAVKLANRPAEE